MPTLQNGTGYSLIGETTNLPPKLEWNPSKNYYLGVITDQMLNWNSQIKRHFQSYRSNLNLSQNIWKLLGFKKTIY